MHWRPTRFATGRGRANQGRGPRGSRGARVPCLCSSLLAFRASSSIELTSMFPRRKPEKPKKAKRPTKALALAFPIIPATHSYRRGMLSRVGRSAPPAFLTRRHLQHLEDLHASPMQSRSPFSSLHAPFSLPRLLFALSCREAVVPSTEHVALRLTLNPPWRGTYSYRSDACLSL